ncbi:MAG: F0F1 ATP synthase subunit epsilon [Flavobacteriaceae bacterium]|nr:F0F1 ATP synthase subunit epsilon [Flavobacteriaceae bacterium]
MLLEILTPDKTLYAGEVKGVQLPGTGGSFELKENHAPIVSSLTAGTVTARTAEGDKTFEITGGVVEMLANKVVVLA